MIAALWAYEGWQFGTYSAGEVVDAERAFPRAFLLGSLFLIGLYLVAVLAYLVALGPAAASMTDAIAATAAKAVLGQWAGKFVAATILISVFSSTNSVILTAPRVFYAMAKDDLFFKKLAEVHPRFQTPAASVISLGVLAAILTQAGKFSELVEGVIFVGWIFYGMAGAAIFPLRRKLAGKTLPYQVPGYPGRQFFLFCRLSQSLATRSTEPRSILHSSGMYWQHWHSWPRNTSILFLALWPGQTKSFLAPVEWNL